MAVQLPRSGWSSPVIAGVDWDAGNREKCAKHGVSAEVIEAAFHAVNAVYRDHTHSQGEERFKAIGRTGIGRHLLIVFALRRREDATFIRPISARYMHTKEIANYEEETAGFTQR
jgi:uncharacterized DUF497 family protein